MAVVWEGLDSSGGIMDGRYLYRAKVPGGWLVLSAYGELTMTFYPDPNHEWDGNSLP